MTLGRFDDGTFSQWDVLTACKSTNRHYENNGHLAVNQLMCLPVIRDVRLKTVVLNQIKSNLNLV